jgi:hypothetical protein
MAWKPFSVTGIPSLSPIGLPFSPQKKRLMYLISTPFPGRTSSAWIAEFFPDTA